MAASSSSESSEEEEGAMSRRVSEQDPIIMSLCNFVYFMKLLDKEVVDDIV